MKKYERRETLNSCIQEIVITLNDLTLRERERENLKLLETQARRKIYKLYINKLHFNEYLNLLYKNSVI